MRWLTNPSKMRQQVELQTKRLLLSNPLRRMQVEAAQAEALKAHSLDCGRAIIFLTPGYDRVDGGLLSMASLVAETKRLEALHGAAVFACPFPSEPPVAAYTQFDNELQPVNYRHVAHRLAASRAQLLLHIPECYVPLVGKLRLDHLAAAGVRVQINVLLQNIDLSPTPEQITRLKTFGRVTVTTAHKAYGTPETAARLQCEVFHLSVWVCPERYRRGSYAEKQNIVLLSPDEHPKRNAVIAALRAGLPEYEFRVVRNMAYRDYRSLCASAKFALTFGEGLDGYYGEAIFSGGISSTVFNDRFFTPKYQGLPLLYSDWGALQARLVSDLRNLDTPEAYAIAAAAQFDVLASEYRHDEYLENLVRFYTEGVRWPDPVNPVPALTAVL